MKLFSDMDDNQLYMSIWSLLFTAFMFLVTTIAVYNYTDDKMKNETVQALVNSGADPLEVACLFKDGTGLDAACMIIAQTKAEEAKQNVLK